MDFLKGIFGLLFLITIIFGVISIIEAPKRKRLERERLERLEQERQSYLDQILKILNLDLFKNIFGDLDFSYYENKPIGFLVYNLNKLTNHLEIIKKYYEIISNDEIKKIIEGKYFLGMTEDMAIDSQNKEPDKIEFEILKTKTKKIFIYGNKSSGDVLTFENGLLVRFKDR